MLLGPLKTSGFQLLSFYLNIGTCQRRSLASKSPVITIATLYWFGGQPPAFNPSGFNVTRWQFVCPCIYPFQLYALPHTRCNFHPRHCAPFFVQHSTLFGCEWSNTKTRWKVKVKGGRQSEDRGGEDVERNISVKEFRLLDNGDSRKATMATTPP